MHAGGRSRRRPWRHFSAAIDALAALGATRDACIYALGGGVVGDLAGFAAACWMRGIDCVQLPTTLLAMVDSSVGGKTAVDLPQGKNLVGAFHPPRAVFADTATLRTLPQRELRAGLAEVIKYGAIVDAPFLDWLAANADALLAGDDDALAEAIARSCAHKAAIVERDPFEHGERALLNFGHTFGHAIETEQGYGTTSTMARRWRSAWCWRRACRPRWALADRHRYDDPARAAATLRPADRTARRTRPGTAARAHAPGQEERRPAACASCCGTGSGAREVVADVAEGCGAGGAARRVAARSNRRPRQAAPGERRRCGGTATMPACACSCNNAPTATKRRASCN